MAADAIALQSTIPAEFYRFWPEFYRTPRPGSHDREIVEYFDALFAPLTDRLRAAGYNSIRFISVFQPNPEPPASPADVGGPLRISWSGEGHQNEPFADYDLNLIMRATHRPDRIICFPLFVVSSEIRNYWPIYSNPRPLPPQPKPYFCAFVVSNPTAPIRNSFFQKLSAYKPVISCGGALNNCNVRAPFEPEAYFKFLSQFKFMICFENRAVPEYMTEKLHNAYLGGTIPIYWGAARSREWLNPRAFFYLPEEPSEADMDALVAQIAALDQDPAAYAEMFAQPLVCPQDAPVPAELSMDHFRKEIVATLQI